MSRIFLIWSAALFFAAAPAAAQELTALARVLPDESYVRDEAAGLEIALGLSQGVPFRVFSLTDPLRFVIDFNEASWSGISAEKLDQSDRVLSLRVGAFKAGWSRMVLELAEPLRVQEAAITTNDDQTANLRIKLTPVSNAEFEAMAGAPVGALFVPVAGAADVGEPMRRQTGDRPLTVVLDPGHGGVDPGAEADGVVEADLMLEFARELQETLIRSGNMRVVLTREDDSFVPLEVRVSIARRARADVFLSLHADALVEGRASGATIYTLSSEASDVASQKLAERHDRGDLLAGVDLSDHDDVIANVLMDIARTETEHRTDKLAAALVTGLTSAVEMHKRPRLSAGFSVLKAPDIPSVLIELGFLSSPRDRKRLRENEWRRKAAIGIRDALQAWAIEDAAEALLQRK